MPKEKINRPRPAGQLAGSTDNDVRPPASERIPMDDVIVQVGWHKESWVQVSIEADTRYFRFAVEHPDADAFSHDTERSTVYSPPLTRDELNNLIRTLRRARDQAFGRDE